MISSLQWKQSVQWQASLIRANPKKSQQISSVDSRALCRRWQIPSLHLQIPVLSGFCLSRDSNSFRLQETDCSRSRNNPIGKMSGGVYGGGKQSLVFAASLTLTTLLMNNRWSGSISLRHRTLFSSSRLCWRRFAEDRSPKYCWGLDWSSRQQ